MSQSRNALASGPTAAICGASITQPVMTSTWPVLSGSVSEPITCTWTWSRGS